MRQWVHLIFGVSAALAAGLLLVVLLVVPGLLWVFGVLLLATAVWLFFWGFERDELFKDDWVELGEIALALVCALAGVVFLVVHFV